MVRDSRDNRRDGPASEIGARDAQRYLGSADLDEILAALDMPPPGLHRWLRDVQAFCTRHGGARYYGELMALVAACQERLERGR